MGEVETEDPSAIETSVTKRQQDEMIFAPLSQYFLGPEEGRNVFLPDGFVHAFDQAMLILESKTSSYGPGRKRVANSFTGFFMNNLAKHALEFTPGQIEEMKNIMQRLPRAREYRILKMQFNAVFSDEEE